MVLLLTLIGLPRINESGKIFCQVEDTLHYFYCSGQPKQFYLYIIYIIWALLILYLYCSFYNLFWIWFPQCRPRTLSGLMMKMKTDIDEFVKDTNSLLDLEDMYFSNSDMKLLLDLLSINSGIAPCFYLLGIFDAGFRNILEISNMTTSTIVINNNQIDGIISFQESKMVQKIFIQSLGVHCIYSFEISPTLATVSSANIYLRLQ